VQEQRHRFEQRLVLSASLYGQDLAGNWQGTLHAGNRLAFPG
jgi:hypothetical protein